MQPKTEDNECLEEYLLKCASKDEFVSRDVLDCRLQSLIRNLPTSNHSQHLHHFTSSSSTIGTMIPNPRVPLSASLNLPITHSVEKSVIAACDYSAQQPNTFCTGNLLPNGNTSNAGVYGFLSNGYQQSPAHVSIDSVGTEGVPSVVVQRGSSQMIFTPKFSDTRSLTNSEPSNSDGQSTTVTQLQGREYISGQNNCLLPYFGVRAGIGTRSNLQQNPSSHNFQRDAANGGLDFMGNNKQLVHETPVSDNYLTAIPNGNSSEHLHQHFNQKRLTPGDGSEKNGTDLVGNGSLYGIASFTGSAMNNPDMDHFSIHSKSKTNSLIASEPNLEAVKQKTRIKPDILDSPSKINMRASRFSQQLKFQHQPLQIGSLSEHNRESVQHLAEQQTDHCPHLAGNEGLQSSEFQNQFQQMTDAGDGSNVVQMICQPFGVGQDISVSVNSQHMHTLEQDPDSQIKFTDLSAREATESLLQEQWHPNSLEKPHTLYQSSREQPAQNLSQRIRGHDEAWRSSLSSEGSTTVYPAASRRASVPQQEIYNSQRWLLFLMHARRCMFPEGKCHSVDCIKVQRLLKHMKACNLEQCPYPSCSNTKKLMKHHKLCKLQDCQICVPVHRYLLRRAHCRTSDGGLLNSKKGSGKHFDARGGAGLLSETIQSTGKTSEDRQSTVKRMKTEISSSYSQIKVEKSPASVLAMSLPQSSQDAQKQVCPEVVKVDADVMMAEPPLRFGARSLHSCENKADKGVDSHCMKHEVEPYLPLDVEPYIPHDVEPYIPTEHADPVKQDGMEIEQEINQAKVDIKQECAVLHSEHAAVMNLGKTKEQGVSLTEVCNPEQVGEDTNGPVKQLGIYVEQGTNLANSQIQLESTVHSEQAATMNLAKPKVQVASLTGLFNPKHVREHVAGLVKKEGIDIVQGTDQSKLQDHPATTKLAKPTVQGVSLTEVFTPEQVKEHITGLRQWIGQSKAKAEKKQAMEHSMSENSCQLCAVEKLTFEPPPMYCMNCAARIKRNTMYYTMVAGETRYYFCISCYNDTRGHNIEVYGTAMLKASMEKKKNDEEIEESWVQCDKCETWQHQICALFNGRRNDGGQAEYTCPYCYIGEIERGERKPLPQSSVLGAKDLPRTILSDHIEQRLFRRLKQERQERARVLGKHIDEVPGAESLVVRVVSSVDKKLEVKQQFLEIFQEENYPKEFPYKSKVILLFQKIEGVEVCLFGMYVQEFGSECQFPNQRRVYLSYLDSVKYFRPEIKTISGEALRTFVYHEILIGYLEYCKRRGFVSCYIWACPPVKGEDYILYCHPEIQKTPKSDKLREWYLSMLRKAAKENIVVDLTNLYDHFFVSTGECKAKVTAARLPYFDGDYWPGAAEDFMNQLSREEDDKKQQKKGKLKKIITKRSLKAAGHTDISDNNSKDIRLMHKLSTSICPMKEDFIMVHLQHSCTHCCNLMVSGNRWVCNQCKNFQLCDKCHDAEDRLCERDRHPIHARDTHVLHPVEVRDVPADTKDRDEILESEFFDTRQAFLSLCQGNHYQYDTLRRAKHSSMMVLYHLHNPTAPAFVTTCNVCHNDIEAGQGWRCEICTDYDVCDVCFKKDGSVDHPHKLTNHPSIADCYAQNKEARQKRVLQLRKMLDLLVHASQCRSQHCSYTNCRRVKALFRHGMQCKIRASKGCGLCKKMWYILKLHARACKESECHVPRCRDLKEHPRRLQQQSDSRRRAAVMEMVRQRAEEVAGNTS